MKGISNLQLTEWKEKVIAFIFIGLWMILTYKFIIEPYNEIQSKKKQKLSLEVKVKKAEKELEEVKKIYQKKSGENKKEKTEYEIYEKTLLERGFQNSGKMEEYIYQKSKENKIIIEVIGGIEKNGTTEKERKGKVYIPYSIGGEEKNILKWIKEIESSEKLISFTDTPFQFCKNENNIKINLKISGYILNDTPKEKNTKITEKEKIFYTYNEKEIMTEKNIIEINGKIYMIIRFKNGKRKIFTHGEEIKKDSEQYILRIEDNELYLEKKI
ncbi:hypothetical protein [uncultured Fusobacterium sp.]|uniref:hypothetical protein n=1 Tax=uncultured Fusobacterium sp. TaxID=159267 RepID=UPI000BBA86AA|nr:hypothetical protein [uncultured Fusobacterium sp.]BBA49942.1 hypothetical protein FV113G1_02890 [Fusobacterium varium]